MVISVLGERVIGDMLVSFHACSLLGEAEIGLWKQCGQSSFRSNRGQRVARHGGGPATTPARA